MQRGLGAICMVLAGWCAWAQDGAKLPAFEVASVKPDARAKMGGEGSRREMVRLEPGRLTMLNVTLRRAMQSAFKVNSYQVTGPAWTEEERYDISAKAADAVPEEELRLMLQRLLEERFHLEFHRQKKELPAFVLTVAKGGPKFKESKTAGEFNMQPTGKATASFQHATVAQLTDLLSNVLKMPVMDETGLKGQYDVSVDMTSYIPENMDHNNPTLDLSGIVISALQDQLGLKLESRKQLLDMLIIDRAEKEPVEN